MNEENILISLIFKEGVRASEVQLILSHISEILKEMQEAEREEENVSSPLCASVNNTPSGE